MTADYLPNLLGTQLLRKETAQLSPLTLKHSASFFQLVSFLLQRISPGYRSTTLVRLPFYPICLVVWCFPNLLKKYKHLDQSRCQQHTCLLQNKNSYRFIRFGGKDMTQFLQRWDISLRSVSYISQTLYFAAGPAEYRALLGPLAFF